MSSMDYERWSDLVDRETSGEILSEEERIFAREFEGSDEAARAEDTDWPQIAALYTTDRQVQTAAVPLISSASTGTRPRSMAAYTG